MPFSYGRVQTSPAKKNEARRRPLPRHPRRGLRGSKRQQIRAAPPREAGKAQDDRDEVLRSVRWRCARRWQQ